MLSSQDLCSFNPKDKLGKYGEESGRIKKELKIENNKRKEVSNDA